MENGTEIQVRWVPEWEEQLESVVVGLDEPRRREGREVEGDKVGGAEMGENASDSAERLPWKDLVRARQ